MKKGKRFCSKCGAPIGAQDAFCSRCGQPVSPESQPAEQPSVPSKARNPIIPICTVAGVALIALYAVTMQLPPIHISAQTDTSSQITEEQPEEETHESFSFTKVAEPGERTVADIVYGSSDELAAVFNTSVLSSDSKPEDIYNFNYGDILHWTQEDVPVEDWCTLKTLFDYTDTISTQVVNDMLEVTFKGNCPHAAGLLFQTVPGSDGTPICKVYSGSQLLFNLGTDACFYQFESNGTTTCLCALQIVDDQGNPIENKLFVTEGSDTVILSSLGSMAGRTLIDPTSSEQETWQQELASQSSTCSANNYQEENDAIPLGS